MESFPKTVTELLAHKSYDGFITDKLGNDLFINDPDRADRLHEAAQEGCDGSTNAEHIEDWREFSLILFRDMKRTIEDGSIEDVELEENMAALTLDIDKCEMWHTSNQSLDKQN